MNLNLKGKTALVTGGSRGIGTAICLAFAAEGANVVVNYNSNGEKAEQVVKDIKEKYGTDAIAVGANVANSSYSVLYIAGDQIRSIIDNTSIGHSHPEEGSPLSLVDNSTVPRNFLGTIGKHINGQDPFTVVGTICKIS